jgi:hypothetical protein
MEFGEELISLTKWVRNFVTEERKRSFAITFELFAARSLSKEA